MKIDLFQRRNGALIALSALSLTAVCVSILALAAGKAAAADAPAKGFYVVAPQEALIKPGMTMDQVRQTLGRPTRAWKYVNQPGQTFQYGVIGKQSVIFEIDFSADGKVLSSSERVDLREDSSSAF